MTCCRFRDRLARQRLLQDIGPAHGAGHSHRAGELPPPYWEYVCSCPRWWSPRNSLSQVASRWGVDLLATLKIRQRIESSRVLSALNKNPTFKLAFGTTFALAAFMHF